MKTLKGTSNMNNLRIQDLLMESFNVNQKRIAISEDEKQYTYEQLDSISENIAYDFKDNESRTYVIITKKLVNRILCMVSVMKLNSVFMNIDIETPMDRIKVLLNQMDYDVILTDDSTILSNDALKNVVLIDEAKYLSRKVSYDKTWGVLRETECHDEVYIAFTSGSTGIPKLISGRNTSLAHFIDWQIKQFGITADNVIGQITSPNFDVFLRDTLMPLSVGAHIAVPPKECKTNPRKLLMWINSFNISLLHISPSYLDFLLSIEESDFCMNMIKYVFIAGEVITSKLLQKWYDVNKVSTVVGLYGPAEGTLAKMFYEITPEAAKMPFVPLGKPISHTSIRLIDQQGEEVKTGEVGEILIYSDYLSFGYKNDISMNCAKFLVDENGRVYGYRTGDMAVQCDNGELRFTGRIDRQVKINGIRFELNEIEYHIEKFPNISKSAVVYNKNRGVICYYTAEDEVNSNELITHLSKVLPYAVIPKYYVYLNSIPLNINKKKDYTLLSSEEYINNNIKKQKSSIDSSEVIMAIENVFDIELNPENMQLDINSVVDSLVFLMRIMELEEALQLSLSDEVYQSRDFKTLIERINNCK